MDLTNVNNCNLAVKTQQSHVLQSRCSGFDYVETLFKN